jgi:hypothetical protein
MALKRGKPSSQRVAGPTIVRVTKGDQIAGYLSQALITSSRETQTFLNDNFDSRESPRDRNAVIARTAIDNNHISGTRPLGYDTFDRPPDVLTAISDRNDHSYCKRKITHG